MGLRILIVDKDQEYASQLQKILQENGCEGFVAANGMEAYNICINGISKNTEFDEILAEVDLPKLNGIELLEKIRSNDFLHSMRFVLMSVKVDFETISAAKKLHVTDFLVKPISETLVRKKLAQLALRNEGKEQSKLKLG